MVLYLIAKVDRKLGTFYLKHEIVLSQEEVKQICQSLSSFV